MISLPIFSFIDKLVSLLGTTITNLNTELQDISGQVASTTTDTLAAIQGYQDELQSMIDDNQLGSIGDNTDWKEKTGTPTSIVGTWTQLTKATTTYDHNIEAIEIIVDVPIIGGGLYIPLQNALTFVYTSYSYSVPIPTTFGSMSYIAQKNINPRVSNAVAGTYPHIGRVLDYATVGALLVPKRLSIIDRWDKPMPDGGLAVWGWNALGNGATEFMQANIRYTSDGVTL